MLHGGLTVQEDNVAKSLASRGENIDSNPDNRSGIFGLAPDNLSAKVGLGTSRSCILLFFVTSEADKRLERARMFSAINSG